MSSADVPMEVASIRMEEDGSQVRVTFELANTQSSKLYDFVKLFIGEEYIGLKYLDIPSGETRPVEFRFDPTAITGAPDMILTAGDRDDGVLFREPLREVSDKDLLQTDAIREQAKKLAETEISDETWERLEDEYIDLIQDEASRKRHVMERLREEYEQLREEKQQEEATEEPFEEEEQGEEELVEPEGMEPEAQERDPGEQAIEHDEQEEEKTDEGVRPAESEDAEQVIEPEEPDEKEQEIEEPSGPEEGKEDEDIQVQTLDEEGWDEEEEGTEEVEAPEKPAQPVDGQKEREERGTEETTVPEEPAQPTEDEDKEQDDEEDSVLDAEPEGPRKPEKPVESPEKHGDVGEAIQEHEKKEKEPEPQSNLLQSVVGSVFGSESVEEETEEQEDDEDEQSDEDDGEENERSYGPDESELNDIPTIDADIKPSEQVKRRSTGIEGLDSKMQGGLVDGTMNLVTGKTGTGKTAFCANFLRRGAELDEPGVYVTTEEREEDIMADIESMFGWDFRKLEERNKVKILSIKPIFPSKEIDNLNRLVRSYISNLLDEVMQAVEDIEAERVIIDSVSIIEMFIRDEYMARVALASLLNKLREAEVTAVLTGTVPETSEGLSGGGIIEFLVDTVLLMEFVPVAEEYSRTLTIRKMRRTDHEVEIFPIEITPNGMKLVEV